MEPATEDAPRRPVLVWIVSLGYGLVALGGVINTFLLVTGAVPEPSVTFLWRALPLRATWPRPCSSRS